MEFEEKILQLASEAQQIWDQIYPAVALLGFAFFAQFVVRIERPRYKNDR